MRRVIVGTAGHIDHGKTRLVQALTGIDCDRWAEEKTRGITIDLGFAHLERGDFQVGFVDVPGHERFLHNALAGLGGIRVMLLVVAADEGVKPQTREHLDVCSLLGIPAGIVALTKKDLAAPDLVELAELEVAELLEGGPFEDAPILAVSSETGEGVPELEAEILRLAGEQAFGDSGDSGDSGESAARLPVDRAFHLKGVGVIVTGTLVSGSVKAGDALELLPGGLGVRVRGVQVHGEARSRASTGERTSLHLSSVELSQLARGMQLGTPGAFQATRRLLGRFRLLPDAPREVKGFQPVRLHSFAAEVVGKMRPLGVEVLKPGETGAMEIRLAEPVVALRGDRFIARRPSPAATVGGGEVLDPAWLRRRGAALERALTALQAGDREALLLWVADSGARGTGSRALAPRLGLPEEEVRAVLAALAAEGRLLEVSTGSSGAGGDRWLAPQAYQRVAERARGVLADFFRRDRLARGMPKAEAVQRILPGKAAELAAVYLGWLEKQKVLALDGDLVTLPGRKADLTGEESRLAKAVEAAFEKAGLAPPAPSELGRTLGAKGQILDGVVRYLVIRERLRRIGDGLIVSAAAVEQLAADLRATDWQRFTVPRFKDHFGLTRKWAIPLLEHLDSRGVTRRLGDERMVVRED